MNRGTWQMICSATGFYLLGLTVSVALLLLTGFSLLFAESGTRSYALAMVNVVILVIAIVLTGSTWYRCEKYEERESSR